VVQERGGFNTADLLARADAAMYAAKHAGKNCVIAA
jgi:GGDEF domain-containing protein